MQLFTGLEYLKIDIANNLGYDKLDYDVRLKKFDESFSNTEYFKTVNNKDLVQYIDSLNAEEPELAFAGMLAYRDYLNGKKSGYMISFDAVNSGSQCMSALMRCESGLDLTGLVSNKRMDMYTVVYKRFLELSGTDKKVERKHIKKAIMTFLYGSKATPKRVIGKDLLDYFYKAMQELCIGAYQLRQILLDSWNPEVDVQEWLLPDLFNAYVPVTEVVKYGIEHSNLPENSYIEIKTQKPSDSGLSNVANVTHSIDSFFVREIKRRTYFDPTQITEVLYLLNMVTPQMDKDNVLSITEAECQAMVEQYDNRVSEFICMFERSGVLSVRIADYITNIADVLSMSKKHRDMLRDALIKMLKQGCFDLVAVHDAFRCLPNNMNYVRYWYNDIMANIVDSDLLDCILKQMSYIPVEVLPQYEYRKQLAEKVRNSNYGIT